MIKMTTLGAEIRKQLADMESGVYDYTVDGKCSNCGSCCSNLLPVSAKEIKTIKRYIQKHGITEQRHRYPTTNPVPDMTCPFRSESERKCLIYDVRPAICRDFQCDKPRKRIQADKAMYHGRFEPHDMRETFFSEVSHA